MRSWKSVASLLAVVAVAAACGGGGTPPPANGGDGPAVDPGATPMRTVIVNQDSAAQAYPLEGGRYRVAWTSSDCPDGIDMSILWTAPLAGQQPTGTPFAYSKPTDIPSFNTLIQRVPPGLYTIEQRQPSCATWEIRTDRVGN